MPYFLHLIESAFRCDKLFPLCFSGRIENICLVALYVHTPRLPVTEAETHFKSGPEWFFLLTMSQYTSLFKVKPKVTGFFLFVI